MRRRPLGRKFCGSGGEVGRVERAASGREGDEAAVRPDRPCGLPLLVLSFLVLLEEVEAFGGDSKAAFECAGLLGR
jgi:hypothetical protein